MNEADQELYRKIIKRGLEQIFIQVSEAAGDHPLPPLPKAAFGEEYILTDAVIRALKAYAEANN
tara:strand:- start:532 stop:723 length:192 start_codon:yes stop_codon:yes gene_type:complete